MSARRLWRQVPETAWLKRNPWLTDHISGGDAGLYDLLLNPRDAAFTVPALDALVGAAGLRIACWVEPVRYDPDVYLPDPKLRARTAGLDPVQRAALAEAITGNMGIHIVYCVRAETPVPEPPWTDPDGGAGAARDGWADAWRKACRRTAPCPAPSTACG